MRPVLQHRRQAFGRCTARRHNPGNHTRDIGIDEKILEWMLKLFAKLEALEEEATVGRTTYQFCQAIVEARDSAAEYAAFLKIEFKSAVDTINGKREETLKLIK